MFNFLLFSLRSGYNNYRSYVKDGFYRDGNQFGVNELLIVISVDFMVIFSSR